MSGVGSLCGTGQLTGLMQSLPPLLSATQDHVVVEGDAALASSP